MMVWRCDHRSISVTMRGEIAVGEPMGEARFLVNLSQMGLFSVIKGAGSRALPHLP